MATVPIDQAIDRLGDFTGAIVRYLEEGRLGLAQLNAERAIRNIATISGKPMRPQDAAAFAIRAGELFDVLEPHVGDDQRAAIARARRRLAQYATAGKAA